MRKLSAFLFLLCALLIACTSLADGDDGIPAQIETVLAESSRWAQWTVSDYVCPDDGQTAFVALHRDAANELLCFNYSSGQWKLAWHQHGAVPQGNDPLLLTDRSYDSYAGLSLGAAFSVRPDVPGEWESVYELENNLWLLRAIAYVDTDGESITESYVTKSNQVVYNGWRKKGEVKINGVLQTDLRYFSYVDFVKDPDQLQQILSNPPMLPSGTLKAREIKFTGGQRYSVYQGPDESYGQAADGNAVVSTNDWIQVFGRENGWMMIQYDITRDHMRIGWIEESALPKNASVSTIVWQEQSAWLSKTATVTDDPLYSQSAILTLPQGAWVTVLGTLGDWAYIESSTGDLLRGFVKRDALSHDRVYALENFSGQQAAGTLTVSPDGGVSLDMAVSTAHTPAMFLLKDDYTGYVIGRANLNQQGRFTLNGTLPGSVTSISFIPVGADGAPGAELFRIEW